VYPLSLRDYGLRYVIRGEKLVCYVQVPLAVQDLINHPSYDGLILFCHRASIPFPDNARLVAPTATMAPRSEDVKGRGLGMLEIPGGGLPLFTRVRGRSVLRGSPEDSPYGGCDRSLENLDYAA
jgi:hypothetical protein